MDLPAGPRKCRFSPVGCPALMTQIGGVGKANRSAIAAVRLFIARATH